MGERENENEARGTLSVKTYLISLFLIIRIAKSRKVRTKSISLQQIRGFVGHISDVAKPLTAFAWQYLRGRGTPAKSNESSEDQCWR